MSNIPTVVLKRLTTSVPKFKKILAKAKERDVNESDTEEIRNLIKNEVIKRETLESEAGIEACKQIAKFIKKQARAKSKVVTPNIIDTPTDEH